MGHPEIPLDHFPRIGSLLMRDHDHGSSIEFAKSADDGRIITKTSVAVKLDKAFKHSLEIVGSPWPINVSRQLRNLPSGQRRINLFLKTLEFFFQTLQLLAEVDLLISRKSFEMPDFVFQLNQGFLEFEIVSHHTFGFIQSQ
jgi:hypothetical protein